MKSVKVEEVIKNMETYKFLYMRNYTNPTVKNSYKPICIIPTGEEKGKLLLARWSNCAQLVVDAQTIVYYE